MDYCLAGDDGTAAMWHGQPDLDLDHDGRLEPIGLDFDHDSKDVGFEGNQGQVGGVVLGVGPPPPSPLVRPDP